MNKIETTQNDKPCTAEGFAYDSKTNDWTERVVYEARNRAEAVNWIRFNRDWFKNLRVI